MSEFFKGWRRKTGCVTLILACLSMVVLVRSREFYDQVNVGTAFFEIDVTSVSGSLTLSVMPPKHDKWHPRPWFVFWYSEALSDMGEVDRREWEEHQASNYRPFYIESGYVIGIPAYHISVDPYILVALLTTFSAWILLAKPHRPHSAKTQLPSSST